MSRIGVSYVLRLSRTPDMNKPLEGCGSQVKNR
jgi:hypothetical protein